MAQENSGLLIAALVAIVAVVGLVILFKGGNTGAAICPPGQTSALNQNFGAQGWHGCVPTSGSVMVMPMAADQGGSDDPKFPTFQTYHEAQDRRYQIAQRQWKY